MIVERRGRFEGGTGACAKVQALQDLLDREGLDAVAGVAGDAEDIAAVRAHGSERTRLAELGPEIRALGFRYVALELG